MATLSRNKVSSASHVPLLAQNADKELCKLEGKELSMSIDHCHTARQLTLIVRRHGWYEIRKDGMPKPIALSDIFACTQC
jgi:hypothetical protein